ncbi:MAG TPA: ABC transporter permease, partial [Longimicrobiales bacterium]|nr:ABC transporter permease [Longimicrobiales bacterium]
MSRVMPDFFEALGVRPVLGRLLRPEDGAENAPLVTVISHRTWRRDFGGDREVLGRRLTHTTYQDSYRVVGVAPPGLDYPVGVDYWIPAPAGSAVDIVGRLATGATPEGARSEFLSLVRALDERRSEPRSPETAAVQPLSEAVLGDARPAGVAVVTAVSLLLLIACVNVGNLLMMRTAQRSRALMVRRALGATSGTVARQVLAEGTLIGATGGALGLALAAGLWELLPALAPDRLPRAEMIGLGGVPVALAIAVTSLATLLFAVAPTVVATRWDLAALRLQRRPGFRTTGGRRLRRSLVVVQVALAVVLLVGAGLLVRSMHHLSGLDLGYDAERVAIVELGYNREGREGPQDTYAPLEGVLERIRALPGIDAATPIMSRPFMGSTGVFETQPMLEGQDARESLPPVPLEVGDHELFRALGVPIIRGRGFTETDLDGAPRVAVVSLAVAERLWPGEDPVGRDIRLVTSREHTWTVVGVAGDTRYRRFPESTPTIYLPVRQLQILPAVWTVAVRVRDGDLAALLPTLRTAVADVDPRINVWRAATLAE